MVEITILDTVKSDNLVNLYMVIVVRNGSGVGCEPIVRNDLAGSSPVFHQLSMLTHPHLVKVGNR